MKYKFRQRCKYVAYELHKITIEIKKLFLYLKKKKCIDKSVISLIRFDLIETYDQVNEEKKHLRV